jgi:hypothetical protein
MKQRCLAMLLLFVSSIALGDEGILVTRTPSGATPEQVLSVARQALINRDWTITSQDANSVSAMIKSPRGHAQLRLVYTGTSILWDGSAKSAVGVIDRHDTANTTGSSYPIYFPKRWLKLLRKDITGTLSTIPDR